MQERWERAVFRGEYAARVSSEKSRELASVCKTQELTVTVGDEEG